MWMEILFQVIHRSTVAEGFNEGDILRCSGENHSLKKVGYEVCNV